MTFNTKVEALKTKASSILKDAKDVLENMDQLNEWDSIDEIITNMDALNSIILRVISAVEVAADNLKTDFNDIKSGDKLDAATKILDDSIHLPFWLEFCDGPLLKVTISMAISLLNQTGNKTFGVQEAVNILAGELFPIIGSILTKKE